MSLASWFRNLLSPRPQPAQAELGRNEVCWCGSGKKYKKCHLKSDELKRMEDHYAARTAAAARGQAGGGIVPGGKAKARKPEQAAQPPVKR